jgi:hypothetical protein
LPLVLSKAVAGESEFAIATDPIGDWAA